MNSLNRLAEDWPLEERRNRLPHAALWHELFRFTGQDASDALFLGVAPHSNPVSQFRNALTVADDMVCAWEDVDDDFTGSILFYYGALWLGNAVAIATLDSNALKSREAAHGLTAKFELKSKKYPFLSAEIDFGAKPASIGIINLAFGGDDLSGRECSVSDILAALPEMQDSIGHVGLKSKAIEVHYNPIASAQFSTTLPTVGATLAIDREFDDPWLRDHLAVYQYLHDHQLTIHAAPNIRIIRWHREQRGEPPTGRNDDSELRALCIETAGRRYFLPKIKQRAISEYAAYLAVLYVISDLARYHPDYWVSMQRDRTGEYFLIREFLDIAEDKIPNLVLNHLSRRTYVFRSA